MAQRTRQREQRQPEATVRFRTADAAWTPGDTELSRSRLLTAMQRWGFADLEELHAASIDDPEWFWSEVVDDLRITFSEPFERVLDDADGKPFPRWFASGRLNAATLCAHRHATGAIATKEAVVYEGDSGQRRALSYTELDVEVRRFAANLVTLGVGHGDRVILFLPV